VGTSSPAYKLDVLGGSTTARFNQNGSLAWTSGINIDGPGSDTYIFNESATNGYTRFRNTSTGQYAFTNSGGTNNILFNANGGSSYFNSGSLGIGTTSPGQKLHVVGTIRVTDLDQNANRLVMADANGDLYANSSLVGTGLGDNLGNHTATTTLNMNSRDITNVKEHYMQNWIRWSDNDGLYWSNNGWHIYPTNSSDMQIRTGNSSSGAMRLTNAGTTRGYIYWDADYQGWLNNARQWQLRTRADDGYSPNLYFLESANESWTGNPGNDQGKVEYHSNRFYIASGANSTEIVRFRRSGSDMAMINNSGQMYAHRWYDWGNTAYYADPASTSYFNDMRANIYYDRNNTGYYVDPASTTHLNALRISGGSPGSGKVLTSDGSGNASWSNSLPGGDGSYIWNGTGLQSANFNVSGEGQVGRLEFQGVGGNSGNGAHSYAIFQEGGNWSNPFPDLRIAYHTGIKLGAHYSYNGTRFYNNSDMVTEIFSVGNGDNNVRVIYNLYAQRLYDSNNTAYYTDQASVSYFNDFRPNIIYDRNNTGYYWNGNSTSRMYRIEAQRGWGTWTQYDA
ncbi:MAG: hypothetical protein QF371_06970, partial [Flavobacteriales bacterium]|nr:hypothetical protein [Flavobacteriales bacterium]